MIAAVAAAAMLVGAVLMIYDKWAAKHRTHARIPEAALLFLAAIGGAPAMCAAMYVFRHKTRKPKFAILFPLLALAWAALLWYILTKEGRLE